MLELASQGFGRGSHVRSLQVVTIKHGKAATDARRGQLFTKLTREIIAAARQGGPSPDTNFRLRMAVQKAKDNNMPSGNVDRAIKRATGDGSGQDQMSAVTYEGTVPEAPALCWRR